MSTLYPFHAAARLTNGRVRWSIVLITIVSFLISAADVISKIIRGPPRPWYPEPHELWLSQRALPEFFLHGILLIIASLLAVAVLYATLKIVYANISFFEVITVYWYSYILTILAPIISVIERVIFRNTGYFVFPIVLMNILLLIGLVKTNHNEGWRPLVAYGVSFFVVTAIYFIIGSGLRAH